MHRKNSQKLLLLSAVLTVTGILLSSSDSVQAAEPAFVIKTQQETDPKNFNIDAETFAAWATPAGNQTYISFEPEQVLNNFVSIELGLRTEGFTQLRFEKYNTVAIYGFLRSIESEINQNTEEAKLVIKNGRATEFNPGKNGRDLNIKSSIEEVITSMDNGLPETQLVVNEAEPSTKLEDTNDLGIKELVGFGDSSFRGSPKNRIFNIGVGVKKETGIILKPGQEFSFNEYLGPVDGEHGFLPELVIKKTGTVPEFGGGLCQVSSTVFRAAMKAGLPITARRNHSYAVEYYAPQGTDATIYPGVQDLKFLNNTPNSILIWPEIFEKTKLRFSFYGTRDGREVTLEDPQSYDKKSSGALKAVWRRTTKMPTGEVLKDTFNSVYQSPALFHKVTTYPANISPDPTVPPTEPQPTPTEPAPLTN